VSTRTFELCDYGDLVEARQRVDGVVDGRLLAVARRRRYGPRPRLWDVYRGDDLKTPATSVASKAIARQRVGEYATEALTAGPTPEAPAGGEPS